MKDRLTEWLVPVLMSPGEEEVSERMQAVTQAATDLTQDQSLDLIKALFTQALPNEVPAPLRTFETRGQSAGNPLENKEEMRVLIASIIAAVIDAGDSRLSNVATLACLCAASTLPAPLPDLKSLARDAMRRRSIDVRNRQAPIVSKSTESFSQALKELEDAVNAPAPADVRKPLEIVHRGLTQVKGNVTRLHNLIKLQQEELDILWWHVGGYSYNLQLRFEEMSPLLRALVSARELAEKTSLVPPPLAYDWVLAQAVGRSVTGDWETERRNVPAAWLQSLTRESPTLGPEITPVHAALLTGIALPISKSLDLARQFYLEALLLREIEGEKS